MAEGVPLDLLAIQILLEHAVGVGDGVGEVDLFLTLLKSITKLHLVQAVRTLIVGERILDVGNVGTGPLPLRQLRLGFRGVFVPSLGSSGVVVVAPPGDVESEDSHAVLVE
eukprot:CAMPEP_0170512920 /NCGR_PEP_ID=MMETSP0208-20121228/67114_1 /TAXON_ID=197538 /ORGANISM="Strombidium inclinatum, Strain S3" /LENGTH=110 /DNA_ID=CAMNT_0010796601 /DNA_START=4058 /DNA_END=4390 /DNA_ORIENTATION=-